MAGTTPKEPSNKSGEEIKKIIKDKISALEEENIRLEDEFSEFKKSHESYKLDFEQQKIQYEHEIRKISDQNRKLKKEIEEKTKKLENGLIDADYIIDKNKELSGYCRNEKNLVIKIFEIINKELDSEMANKLQNIIIEELKNKRKK